MIFGRENQEKEIRDKIDGLRSAAGRIKDIKPIVRQYNGKIYNRRFDEAIRELSKKDDHLWVSNTYGWFYISYSRRKSHIRDITLLSGYSCKAENMIDPERQKDEAARIFNEKRINADKMCESLDLHYAKLLKEAYELELAFDHIDETQKRLEDIKRVYEATVRSLPSDIIDVYGIKRYI